MAIGVSQIGDRFIPQAACRERERINKPLIRGKISGFAWILHRRFHVVTYVPLTDYWRKQPMHALSHRTGLEDFNSFCKSFDLRDVIAAADERGHAEGLEKEIYALAIMRAVHNGDFGADRDAASHAVSALWIHGHCRGFNADSFNELFERFFVYW